MDAYSPAGELIPAAVQPNSDTTSLAINRELGRAALGRIQTAIDSAPRYPSVAVKLADKSRHVDRTRSQTPVWRVRGADSTRLLDPVLDAGRSIGGIN